jgi:hypothetical protein
MAEMKSPLEGTYYTNRILQKDQTDQASHYIPRLNSTPTSTSRAIAISWKYGSGNGRLTKLDKFGELNGLFSSVLEVID